MKVKFEGVRYLGGHPQRTKPCDRLTLIVDDDGVRAKGNYLTAVRLPWGDVVSLDVDGPDTAQKKVTIGRVVAVGVLALAIKKKVKTAYVSVETATGTAVFQVNGFFAPEIRAKLSPILAARLSNGARVGQEPLATTADPPAEPTEPAAQPRSVADELIQLRQLREEGVLTNEEFEIQKSRLLGDS